METSQLGLRKSEIWFHTDQSLCFVLVRNLEATAQGSTNRLKLPPSALAVPGASISPVELGLDRGRGLVAQP
jgi:hypothetical protein